MDDPGPSNGQDLVLYEDKIYHEPLAQVFGDDVEFVEFSESDPEPLVKPRKKVANIATDEPPSVNFNREFQMSLLKYPSLGRNVAIAGHLAHGKTSIVDLLVQETHLNAEPLYADCTYLEQSRKMTLASKVVSLLAPNSRGKSFHLQVIDTPGHADFGDELDAGIVLADTVLLVVDVCEPLLVTSFRAIERAIFHGKHLRVCINKLDRLFLEQRQNAKFATARVFHLLGEIDDAIHSRGGQRLDIVKDVIFASAKYRWSFSLNSIAELYREYQDPIDLRALTSEAGFAKYALDPIVKLFQTILNGDQSYSESMLRKLDITLPGIDFNLSMDELLTKVMSLYFVNPIGPIIDLLPEPSSTETSELQIYVAKYFHHDNRLYALAKILSGSIQEGQQLAVGEVHTNVSGIFLPHSRYNLQLEKAYTGNIVLLGGIDELVAKAGIVTERLIHPVHNSVCAPVIKVGVEAFHPSNGSKVTDGLRLLEKTWPGIKMKIESTGEHLLYGCGELHLDCALFHLRQEFAQTDIKLTDPTTQFRESVSGESYAMCPTSTPNGLNKLTVLVSHFPDAAWTAIEGLEQGSIAFETALRAHGWDALAIDNIMAVKGSNILVNETMKPVESEQLVQGFSEFVKEGPLCSEPLRNVNVKLVECDLADDVKDRPSGQVVPTMKRACFAGQMVASPSILEPVWKVTLMGPIKSGAPAYKLLAARRGKVLSDEPIAGTALFLITAELPVLDSFGFETEVLGYTHGSIRVNYEFSHWQSVPEDPLDDRYRTHKLEKATGPALARDVVLKTRKRKGLSREPLLATLLDPDVAEALNAS